jgi:IclR family acetate operon transcriptional repressor
MYTPRTITDPGLLRAELDAALVAGWASTGDELEIGLNAVAVPIRGMDGNVVAALSVSGPSYRLTTDRFAEVARLAADGAREISHRIGHTG